MTQEPSVQGITVGSSASFSKPVTQDDINSFADVTGDHNPLHSDAEYAARTRFKQPIAHGMLGAGVISAALGTQIAPNSVVIYLGQNLQFRAPVAAGDTITATVTVNEVDPDRNIVKLDTNVLNQEGVEVIRGDATIMVEAPAD
jgi:3-hydroxybutyryl-CoA dehydratase